MKKILSILSLLLLTACNEYDAGFTKEEIVKQTYNKKFIAEFGEVDPLHTWGFSNLETRAVNPNSNQWESDYHLVVPPAITEEERQYVSYWFQYPSTPSVAVHWTDFFIQYVDYSGIGNMDQLGVQYFDGTWEHINDFNTNTNSIKYVYSSGTENWTYRASHSNTFQYDKYWIAHLSFTVNDHHYDGWYVGFDYESLKGDSGDKTADGSYNDWIVKITPGITIPLQYRVMAEDLGYIGDWDFNDVVFDVSYFKVADYTYRTIQVLAAGGTIPLYINNKEVHQLLNVPVNQATNTWGNITVPSYTWTDEVTTTDLNDIQLRTDNYTITSYIGVPPGKFIVTPTVDWTAEGQNISDKYPKFSAWVKDQTILFY